jgi:NADPH:quinone reductase
MVPARMRAVNGIPGEMPPRIASFRVPKPGYREVLVKVAAAGLNRADLSQLKGRYPAPPGASTILGLEVAGMIVGIGPGATRWREGDEVCVLLSGGGYAEYCTVPEGQCLPKPAHLTMIQAASFPEACATVQNAIWRVGGLRAGESVLFHGGVSGIGATALQVTSARGHKIYATAGTDARCALAVQLGAERAINYRTNDFATEVLAATENRGVDVIIDMVGGDYLKRDMACTAVNGRIVVISFLDSNQAEIDLRMMMTRQISLLVASIRYQSIEYKTDLIAKVERNIWPLIVSGKVKPVVDQVLPFEEVAVAHELMQKGTHRGKLVLRIA